MFLVTPIITLFTLKWRQQPRLVRPLPPHIERSYITTPSGPLELLSCRPIQPATAPPILFIHGGYGSASVWLEWMTHLRTTYPGTLYALSIRNHGASYTLPFLTMLRTPFGSIQDDLLAVLDHIDTPILVGHSSGGGLAQSVLAAGCTRARGLCLVGAIPSFGSYDIYANWFKQDAWFPLRSMFHCQHPTSPLSTDELVHGAFFGHKFPLERVAEFRKWMPAFESMGWPMAMVGSMSKWIWGRNEWLDCRDTVRRIDGRGDKVCVMVGREDMMYREWMWQRQVREYQEAIGEETKEVVESDGPVDERRQGCVRLLLVKDSGHHVQNDVYWEQAADAFCRWAKQV